MDMNQMLPLMMAMMGGGNAPATPAAKPAAAPANGNGGTRITFTRTVNLFRRASDKRMMISIGDLTAPWQGAARAIRAGDCVKTESGKAFTTRNEWEVTVEIGQYGRVRILKATDTGIEYSRDDFGEDAETADDGFGDSEPGDKPDSDAGTL